MVRWRMKTKILLVYLLSLSVIVFFLGIISFNGGLIADTSSNLIRKKKMLMEKTAVDRIDTNQIKPQILNRPQVPDHNRIHDVISTNKFKKPIKERMIDISKYKTTNGWQIPPSSIFKNISWSDLSTIYHEYIEHIQYDCKDRIRLGKITDGGWDVCDEESFRPNKHSMVYSFGIADDFSFDDAVSQKYQVYVHSFDPSIKLKEHQRSKLVTFHDIGLAEYTGKSKNGWNMFTLQDIYKKLGHSQNDISIMKIDIEEWEWRVLPQLLKTNALMNLKQLYLELHICEGCSVYDGESLDKEGTKDRYIEALQIFQDLYKIGFRIFYSHRNKACLYMSKFTMRDRSACHEVYMVKVVQP